AKLAQQQKQFLREFQPDHVVAVGTFPGNLADLEQRLGVKISALVPWTQGPPLDLWKKLFPRAKNVVVCPPEPRPQLLQAACLAGALRAPLWVNTGNAEENALLRRQLVEWKTQQIYAVGDSAQFAAKLKLEKEGLVAKLIRLRDMDAVAQAHRRILRQQGPIENIVLANPADGKLGLTNLSPLAPCIAVQH